MDEESYNSKLKQSPDRRISLDARKDHHNEVRKSVTLGEGETFLSPTKVKIQRKQTLNNNSYLLNIE